MDGYIDPECVQEDEDDDDHGEHRSGSKLNSKKAGSQVDGEDSECEESDSTNYDDGKKYTEHLLLRRLVILLQNTCIYVTQAFLLVTKIGEKRFQKKIIISICIDVRLTWQHDNPMGTTMPKYSKEEHSQEVSKEKEKSHVVPFLYWVPAWNRWKNMVCLFVAYLLPVYSLLNTLKLS